MVIQTLFTIAKLWRQPRCPTTNEWIKKMWYMYTVAYYKAIKKYEVMSFAGVWKELEFIMHAKLSKPGSERQRSYVLSLM
jgi:hypothetical protein